MHWLVTWDDDNVPQAGICKCELGYDHDLDGNPVALVKVGGDSVGGG